MRLAERSENLLQHLPALFPARRSIAAVIAHGLGDSHVRPRTAMPPTPAVQREAVGLVIVAVLIVTLLPRTALVRLLALRWLVAGLLAAGDKRWQPIDIAAAIVAAALLLGWSRYVLLVLRIRLRLGRQKRLRLARAEGRHSGVHPRLLPEVLVAIIIERFVAGVVVRARKVRIVLAKLFLRRGDQPEIMLGMLVIVFRRYRITGRVRVTGELNVFLSDMRRSAANFDVRTIRFEDP